jgi:hypothetical protein
MTRKIYLQLKALTSWTKVETGINSYFSKGPLHEIHRTPNVVASHPKPSGSLIQKLEKFQI